MMLTRVNIGQHVFDQKVDLGQHPFAVLKIMSGQHVLSDLRSNVDPGQHHSQQLFLFKKWAVNMFSGKLFQMLTRANIIYSDPFH